MAFTAAAGLRLSYCGEGRSDIRPALRTRPFSGSGLPWPIFLQSTKLSKGNPQSHLFANCGRQSSRSIQVLDILVRPRGIEPLFPP